jgi:glycosyltransferase involved in cell wall biosynthesis
MPLVSVGIPVFNGAEFIRDSIESILAQTYTAFELIISDNGSTDGTTEICREYAAQDKRIRFYRNECNIGATKNFRKVFELSRGTYFKWQSYDDMCSNNVLMESIRMLEEDSSIVLAYPFTVVIREDGRQVLSHDCWRLLLNQDKPWKRFKFRVEHGKGPCTAIYGLIRSEALARTRLIDRFAHSDQVLILELALQGKFELATRAVHYYRHHRKQSLKANRKPRERMLWFDTNFRGNPPDEQLTVIREMFRSVNSSAVAPLDKALCYPFILRPYLRRLLFIATGGRLGGMKRFGQEQVRFPNVLATK